MASNLHDSSLAAAGSLVAHGEYATVDAVVRSVCAWHRVPDELFVLRRNARDDKRVADEERADGGGCLPCCLGGTEGHLRARRWRHGGGCLTIDCCVACGTPGFVLTSQQQQQHEHARAQQHD